MIDKATLAEELKEQYAIQEDTVIVQMTKGVNAVSSWLVPFDQIEVVGAEATGENRMTLRVDLLTRLSLVRPTRKWELSSKRAGTPSAFQRFLSCTSREENADLPPNSTGSPLLRKTQVAPIRSSPKAGCSLSKTTMLADSISSTPSHVARVLAASTVVTDTTSSIRFSSNLLIPRHSEQMVLLSCSRNN